MKDYVLFSSLMDNCSEFVYAKADEAEIKRFDGTIVEIIDERNSTGRSQEYNSKKMSPLQGQTQCLIYKLENPFQPRLTG